MRFAPPTPPAAAASAKATLEAKEPKAPKAPKEPKEPNEERKPRERKKADIDPLDPAVRSSAQLAPPLASTSFVTKSEEVTQRSRISLEELIPHVVRRIAWGGDRAKGSAVLELTSGDRITVHAEGRRVRVEADGNVELERRIESRLRAAGIEVESVR